MERLERRFDSAYARFREAEAQVAAHGQRAQAEEVLNTAYRVGVALGAAPLRREIELLARRGRLHLEEPGNTVTTPQAAPSPPAAFVHQPERRLAQRFPAVC